MRICPVNHCELPLHFEEVPNYRIFIVGALASGKSFLRFAIIDKLKHITAESFVSAVDFATLASEEAYLRMKGALPDVFEGTSPRDSGPWLREPIIMQVRWRATPSLLPMLRRTMLANLAFFDTGDNDTTRTETLMSSYQDLRFASGFIVLVDPVAIPWVKDHLVQKGVHDAAIGYASMSRSEEVLASIATVYRNLIGADGYKKLGVPTAIVLTKTDILPEIAGGSSLLCAEHDHRAGFDARSASAQSDAVRRLLINAAPTYVQAVETAFSNFCFFAASSLGAPSVVKGSRVQLSADFRPHNVQCPVLWMLHNYNDLPAP